MTPLKHFESLCLFLPLSLFSFYVHRKQTNETGYLFTSMMNAPVIQFPWPHVRLCRLLDQYSSDLYSSPQVLLIRIRPTLSGTTHNSPSLMLQSSFRCIWFIKDDTDLHASSKASVFYLSVPFSRTAPGLRGPLFLNIELFNALVLMYNTRQNSSDTKGYVCTKFSRSKVSLILALTSFHLHNYSKRRRMMIRSHDEWSVILNQMNE